MDGDVVVGIPTYNNAETIEATFEMLRAQQRHPDRVVFCDKSSDRTPEIIETLAEDADFDVEMIRQTGDGVADAYDQILDYIAGEYGLFVTLQSDLVVEDDWIAGHIEVHEANPEIDLVNGDNKINEPTDREVQPNERPYYVGRNFSAKAGALERIDGWDPNFLRGEDWDMRIRLAGAGIRSYARTAIGYEWQQADPYITLSKAKRRPTSVTFLAKYGRWYLRFHPSHVVSDALSVGAVVTGGLGLAALPVFPLGGVLLLVVCLLSMVVYTLAHNTLRGGVDGNRVLGPPRKQLLNGIAVLYALRRIVGSDIEWNRSGFDPENVPDYGF